MKFDPPGTGFAPPAGSGNLQQNGPFGPMVRRRTIQHKVQRPQKYLGTNFLAFPQSTPWEYEIQKLRSLSHYWAISLSAADRTAWDGVGIMPTGFETFLHWNLTGYDFISPTNLPVLGQNVGDITSPGLWDFSPCRPTVPASIFGPQEKGLTLTFHASSIYSFTSVVGASSVSTRAMYATVYGTRPYKVSRDLSRNPLLRLGVYLVTAGALVLMFDDPMHSNSIPLATLWNRTIGGSRVGYKIDYGWRYSDASRLGPPGPLHLATATVVV